MIFISQSVEQTHDLAKKLAKQVTPGSIISLVGDLGTGKTTFTKGFAKQLGIKDPVTSPTFKLISEYQTINYILYHIDAYRIDGPSDFLNIGGEEYLTSKNNVTIIEWGDLLEDLLPSRTITVNFTRIISSKDSRNIKISGIKFIDKYIMSIETSSSICGVSILFDQEILGVEEKDVSKKHAELLSGITKKALDKAKKH